MSNLDYRLKFGDVFVAQNFKYTKRVIGESAAKLLWPVTPSINRALSAEVRRRFCAPKFHMPNISAIGAWPEIYPMPFWIDLSETRRFN